MGVESTATSEEVVTLSSNGQKPEVKNNKQKKLLPPSTITEDSPRSWKIEDSEALYRIEGWGRTISKKSCYHLVRSQKILLVPGKLRTAKLCIALKVGDNLIFRLMLPVM